MVGCWDSVIGCNTPLLDTVNMDKYQSTSASQACKIQHDLDTPMFRLDNACRRRLLDCQSGALQIFPTDPRV